MKNSVSSALLALAVGLSAAGVSSTAQAVVLLPGAGPVAPDQFNTSIAGSVLATASGPYSASVGGSSINGTFTQEVVKETSTGFLDFVLQVTNGTGDVLERITEAVFSQAFAPIDVGFLTTGNTAGTLTSAAGDIAPGSVDDSVNNVIGFNLLPPGSVPDGATTDVLVIKTDAQSFTTGAISFQDGVTANAQGFAPAPLPVPAALPLLGSVLGAGFLALRRRRRPAAPSMPDAIA
jgi:hypothetical protein